MARAPFDRMCAPLDAISFSPRESFGLFEGLLAIELVRRIRIQNDVQTAEWCS